MNELLAGIRTVKFFGWEQAFGRQIANIRSKELQALTSLTYVSTVGFSLLVVSAPVLQPILVFGTFVKIQNDPLLASTAFTTVALFNIMRFPFVFMPLALVQYVQSIIALKRVVRYLCLPELSSYIEDTIPPELTSTAEQGETSKRHKRGESEDSDSLMIVIRNGTFSWIDPNSDPIQPIQDETMKRDNLKDVSNDKATSTSAADLETVIRSFVPTLRNLSCFVRAGSLVAIVGPVGCGKSAFLSAILGELVPLDGSKIYMPNSKVRGFIAYCSQTPWVINDTIRGNILFGREYHAERYNQVIEACALRDDLAVLPSGDNTEIGERGINLSGGQKARVSLARAIYSTKTSILLLDDPLSAVDSNVSNHLFTQVIRGEVTKGTTRLLVTHHSHVLPECDHIIVLHNGEIRHQGSYDELIALGVDFAGAIEGSRVEPSTEKSKEPEIMIQKTAVIKQTTRQTKDGERIEGIGAKLVDDEEREEGGVEGAIYLHYARAGGMKFVVCIGIVVLISRGLEVLSTFWLARWADQTDQGAVLSNQDTTYYLGLYSLFGMLAVASSITKILAFRRSARAIPSN